jgi:formylglycine-generating enzyme required for sulfatase activity
MKFIPIAASAACLLPPSLLSADLPNAQLLPTTRAIHELILKNPDPSAAEMASYVEKVKSAGDATLDLVAIKGGEFTLGSPESEPDRKADEGPQRKVKIEPFWMGKIFTAPSWKMVRVATKMAP